MTGNAWIEQGTSKISYQWIAEQDINKSSVLPLYEFPKKFWRARQELNLRLRINSPLYNHFTTNPC